MTRRDIVIVDIPILLSSASIPLISFVSFLFLPRSSRGSAFTSSFYQSVILSSSLPSRFFILLCLSIVPVLSYTALLLLPSSSSVISLFFFHPAFCAYPVIISSSFLFVFFYRSASLPRFSLLSTSSRVSPSRSFLLHLVLYLLSLLCLSQPPLSSIFMYFLYPSVLFYLFSSSFTVHALVRS